MAVNQANLRGSGRVAQLSRKQQRTVQRQQQEVQQQQQQAQQQKTELQQKIEQTKAEIKRLQVQETKGSTVSALGASAQKYGKQAELANLEKAYQGIQGGGYYTNFQDVLKGAEAQGAYTTQAESQRASVVASIQSQRGAEIPKGAKITKIENGVITYSLPSQQQAGVTSQSQVSGNQNVYYNGQKVGEVQQGKGIVLNKQGEKLSNEQLSRVQTGFIQQDVGQTVKTFIPKTNQVYSFSDTSPLYQGREVKQEINLFDTSKSKIKANEFYSSSQKGFISQSPTGYGSTAYYRPLTAEEQKRYNKLQSNILTANLEDVKKDVKDIKNLEVKLEIQSKQLGNLNEEIKSLEKNNVDVQGNWVGSEKDLKKYNELIDKQNKLSLQNERDFSKYEAQNKIGVGFFNFDKKYGQIATRDIRQYDFERRPLSSTINVLGTTVGGTAENLFFKASKRDIGKEMTYLEPQFGTIQRNVLTGEQMPYKEVKYIQTEQGVREQARIVGTAGDILGTGVAFVVGGEPLFLGYATELGVDIAKTKKETGTITKQQKIEAGITGGLILGGAAFRSVRYLERPIVREVEGGYKVTSRADQLFGGRIRFSKPQNALGIKTEYLPSQRGRYFLFEDIKAPRTTVQASEPIGREYGNVIKFKKQKLGQYATSGRRTIVKQVKPNRLGVEKTKILYEGIPYKQQKQYAKQLKYLTKLVGEKSARNILRYSAPQVQEQYLSGGLKLGKNIAIGKFISTTEKPVLIVDESLGIKTRGGRTLTRKEYVGRVGGQLDLGGTKVNVGFEDSSSILSRTAPKRNAFDLVGFDFEKSVSLSQNKIGRLSDRAALEEIGSVSLRKYTPADNRRFLDIGKTSIVKEIPPQERVNVFQGGGGRSSQEYLQSLYKPELKIAPRVEPPKAIIKPTPTKLETPKTTSPTIKPVPVSQYSGQGIYERTEGGLAPQQNEAVVLNVKSTQDNFTRVSQPTISRGRVELKVQQNIKQPLSQKEVLKNINKTNQFEIKAIKVAQETKQKSLLRQALETIQAQKIIQRQQLKNQTKNVLSREKASPKGKIPFGKLPAFAQVTKGKKVKELFEAFGFRFGKPVSLGGGTKTEAETLLGKFLKGTLGASGYLETGGQKVKAKELNLLEETGFRIGKKNPYLIVEKRERRLKKGGTEVSEIQYFKRKGKRKNTLF